MKRIILFLLAEVLLLASCTPRDVIPANEMSKIYYDMYVTDQCVDQVHSFRSAADSLDVYAGIFEKHGYTTEEFLSSLDYYIRNADKLARILKHTQNDIKKRYDYLMQQPEEFPEAEMEESDVMDNHSDTDVEENEKEPGERPLLNTDSDAKHPSDKKKMKEKKLSRKQLKELEKKLK